MDDFVTENEDIVKEIFGGDGDGGSVGDGKEGAKGVEGADGKGV